MKNWILVFMLLMAVIALTACGSQASEIQENQTQEPRSDAATTQSESPVIEAALLSNDEVMAMVASQTEQATETATEAAIESAQTEKANNDRPVDLDLTAISGTVVYSQVYDMMMQPEAYLGQKIRMRGNFSYYQDPDTGTEYFAAVIADATACCAQGIEFVWKGEHSFPQDYPPLDTEITVTGTFGTYIENGYMYIQLTDADMVWQNE